MSFDHDANPEHIAARAAELALEQHDRLRLYMKKHKPEEAYVFYHNPFECGISNRIASLNIAYAVLVGLVTAERAGLEIPI